MSVEAQSVLMSLIQSWNQENDNLPKIALLVFLLFFFIVSFSEIPADQSESKIRVTCIVLKNWDTQRIGKSLKIVKIIILADPNNWTTLRKRKSIRNCRIQRIGTAFYWAQK